MPIVMHNPIDKFKVLHTSHCKLLYCDDSVYILCILV